jgi:hypothetical protein
MKTSPDPPSSMERHSRKCAICAHPARQAIDQAFLHRSRDRVWADDSAQQNVVQIVTDYNLPSLSSLYRHAHATGLMQTRHSNRESRVRADDSARQYIVENSNRESNRENKPYPAVQEPPEPNSNRESNRENARIPLTAEIQRMLIGK